MPERPGGEARIFLRPDILGGLLPNLVTERNAAGLSWLIDALQNEDPRRSAPKGAFDELAEVVRTRSATMRTSTGNCGR